MIRIRTFLVLIVLVALVPLAALNIINYETNIDTRRRVILNRNLEVARSVAVGFRAFVLQIVQMEEAAGLAINEGGFNNEQTHIYLAGLLERNRHLRTLTVADPDGRIIASHGREPDAIPQKNLIKLKNGQAWAVSSLEPDPNDSERAEFHITAAIRMDKEIVSVVDAVVHDEVVFDFIKIRIGRRGNVGIIDDKGRAAALSFKRNLDWSQRDRTFISSIREALNGEPATVKQFHDPLGNIDRMGASVPIREFHWVANVFQPVDEVLAPVRRQGIVEGAQSFVVSLVALALVLVLAQVIARPISELAAQTVPFRRGEFDHRLPVNFNIVEIKELAEALNRTAAETQSRFEAEQHIASTLQTALLPVEPPPLPGYEIGTRYASATKQALVGGDFYDFIILTPQKVGVIIGDIQGKGIDAAVATATTKFALRDLAARYESPAQVLSILNKICRRELTLDQFITLIYMTLDLRTGLIDYASAGHHPPTICSQKGCRALTEVDIALGIVDEVDYNLGRARIEPKETLVLYTDGVVEARTGKELFGLDRLDEVIVANLTAAPGEICEAVYESCVKFGGDSLRDDLALVCIKRIV